MEFSLTSRMVLKSIFGSVCLLFLFACESPALKVRFDPKAEITFGMEASELLALLGPPTEILDSNPPRVYAEVWVYESFKPGEYLVEESGLMEKDPLERTKFLILKDKVFRWSSELESTTP